MRSSLLSLNDVGDKIKTAQLRLATGKRVNSALDNPTNYFAAVANLQKVSDLTSLKDGIEEATQVLKVADAGMAAITGVLRQAAAIADTATTSTSRSQLSQYLDQFNNMRGQVDQVTVDANYKGLNLLRRQDLNISLGGSDTLTISGDDATASGFDNMTDGLKVNAATFNPLSVTEQHTVSTSTGAIKQDGALTVTNNDFQSIDTWLGNAAINIQSITSQDLAVSTSPTMSDGRAIASQIINNEGVAAYGSNSFSVYRDTSVAVTGTSDPLVSASAGINNLADVSAFLGPISGSATAPITLTKAPSIQSASVLVGSSGSLTSATINDAAAVSRFLDTQSFNPALTFSYHGATHLWSTSNPAVSLIQSGNPPATLGLSLDGGVTSAIDINLAGSWSNNDQIQLRLDKWTSSDPNAKVIGYGGNGISLSVDPSLRNDIGVSLSVPESSLAYNTSIDVSVDASNWKASDATVSLSPPAGGVMTADLNGDGAGDLQFQLPTGGPSGAGWLSTETFKATTTGAFRSTDSTLRLRYNSGSGDLGLYFGGGGGGPGISINLSGSWAVSQLASSPLGNGDIIKLTVDGRHRWVLSDNKTPNVGGIRQSITETQDAIDTLRSNSAKNASLSSVLTVRNQFIDTMAGILGTGADNLTLADMNEEGAGMLMLQTRQNLATQSLSMFNDASRNLLKLF